MVKKKLSTILAWTLSIAMTIGSVNVAGAAEVPQMESVQTEDSQTYEDRAENRQEDIIKDDVDIFNAGDVSEPTFEDEMDATAPELFTDGMQENVTSADSAVMEDNVYYSVDEGVLTIEGNGTVADTSSLEGENIVAIRIEKGITAIGSRAFRNYHNLKTVQLPLGLQHIGSEAFRDCEKLQEIQLPLGLTSLGDGIFRGCTKLTELTIPKSLTTLLDDYGGACYPFSGSSLQKVILEDGMETVPNSLFRGCESLIEVQVPESIKKIESDAFWGCTSLQSIQLPPNLEELGIDVFGRCKKLTEITIPKSLTTTLMGAFGESGLKKVTLEDGIETVPDSLFSGCEKLTEVHFPESIRKIGNAAFSGCISLKSIQLPTKLQSIGGKAFVNCKELQEIQLPLGLTKLGDRVFEGCSKLTELTIPKSLTTVSYSIGMEEYFNGPFNGSGLQKVTLEDGTQTVKTTLFWGCDKLTEVNLPESIKKIEKSAFKGCTSLQSIQLPSQLQSIENKAFDNCTALNCVKYPKSEADWKNVSIGQGNANLVNATFYFNNKNESTIPKPSKPVLKVKALNDNQVEITWDYKGELSVLKSFMLKRSENAKDFFNMKTFGDKTFRYIDKVSLPVSPKVYYYQLEVQDIYGRTETSDIISCELQNKDVSIPQVIINSSAHTYTAQNEEVRFSAKFSNGNNDNINYKWDFGDGTVADGKDVTHTFERTGQYNIKLTATNAYGTSSTDSLTLQVVELKDNGEFTKISFAVCNASNVKPISNAQVLIKTDKKEEKFETDENGKLTVVVPNADYIVSVCADKYLMRTFEAKAKGSTLDYTVGLTSTSIMSGKVTVTELDKEAIEKAGINVNAPGNEHVYEFRMSLIFAVGMKTYEFPYIILKNSKNEVLNCKGGGETHKIQLDDEKGSFMNIMIFPITEKFALVIYGETHWLKEMYQVKLVVNNDSMTDTLEQVNATLQLPNGLSLADMTTGTQSLTHNLGTIKPQKSVNTDWYVRGDKEGEYNLSAKVSAIAQPLGEKMNLEFTTTKPVKVYAGNALHMTITCEDYAERGKDYKVKVKLENVSKKSLYNISCGIKNSQQFKILRYKDKETWMPIDKKTDYKKNFTYQIDELAPGGSFEMELSTTIWFNSAAELIAFTKLGTFVDIAYYLTDVVVVATENATTSVPYDIIVERKERESLIDKVISTAVKNLLSENGYHIINSLGGKIVEIGGDAELIPLEFVPGGKTVLKFLQGTTNHKFVISIDDGRGTKDSIKNDIVQITTGSKTQEIVDTLNGTALKLTNGELSINAKLPGKTQIKIGVTNSLGKLEREYVLNVTVGDNIYQNSINLTPDSVTYNYKLNENELKTSIEKIKEKELEIYKNNPFLIMDEGITMNVSGQTKDSKYKVEFSKEQLDSIWNNTALNHFEVRGALGNVKLSRDLVQKVMENGENLNLEVEQLSKPSEMENGKWISDYRLTLLEDDKKIKYWGENKIPVTLPFEIKDNEKITHISVVHKKDNGEEEILPAKYDADSKTVSFETPGFSIFRICADVSTKTPDPKPTDAPVPDPKPTDAPAPDPKPTDAPAPNPKPTDAPVPDPKPTDAPVPDPKPSDVPTPDQKPTDVPTQEELDSVVKDVQVRGNVVTVILAGKTKNASGYDYVISKSENPNVKDARVDVIKNQIRTKTEFKYVPKGTYYAYCHAWVCDKNGKKVFGKWSNVYKFSVSAITPDTPQILSVKTRGTSITVTYIESADSTGYDVVLGKKSKKEHNGIRPYSYGKYKKLNIKTGICKVTFEKIPKGTYYVGIHSWNRTAPKNNRKVFSKWSKLRKVTTK